MDKMLIFKYLTIFAVILAGAVSLSAQTFDASNDKMLSGSYFVREVLISGQDPSTGVIDSAVSATGTVVFDGNGGYTFSGQVTSSVSGTSSAPLTGTYQVSSSGLMNMTSLADPTDVVFGGVAALGPSAFVASATEGTNVDMMIAIPAGTSSTNSALTGSYSAGMIDFLNANVSMVREATFALNADGAGNLGTVSVSGNGRESRGHADDTDGSGSDLLAVRPGKRERELRRFVGIAIAQRHKKVIHIRGPEHCYRRFTHWLRPPDCDPFADRYRYKRQR